VLTALPTSAVGCGVGGRAASVSSSSGRAGTSRAEGRRAARAVRGQRDRRPSAHRAPGSANASDGWCPLCSTAMVAGSTSSSSPASVRRANVDVPAASERTRIRRPHQSRPVRRGAWRRRRRPCSCRPPGAAGSPTGTISQRPVTGERRGAFGGAAGHDGNAQPPGAGLRLSASRTMPRVLACGRHRNQRGPTSDDQPRVG